MSKVIDRRAFLAGSGAIAGLGRQLAASGISPNLNARAQKVLELRKRLALSQSSRLEATMHSNGDEDALPSYIACFKKGLPHNQFGEADQDAYKKLLRALKSGEFGDFESLPRAGGRRLNNPQAAYSYHLEGADPHTFDIPVPPSLRSESGSREMNELYWQALCRDEPFDRYERSALIRAAASDLGCDWSSVFRGSSAGGLKGPYVSQFLLKPIPYGSGFIEQRYRVPIARSDFMTAPEEWLQIQTGIQPWRNATYDNIPRYIRNGRDLAEYVHYDFPYQAYLNAALILINSGPGSTLNCNQFKSPSNPYRYSTIEEGFVTFGQAEVTDWLGRATTAVLKAAYCQKWLVHRRLRPEELSGLIQRTKAGTRKYPLHESYLGFAGGQEVNRKAGSHLLPQAYPEGCPLHPSYPAGHAAIAGACSVILKVCFDGEMLLPACVESNAEGTMLMPVANYSPTVGEEIDKLAWNIALARNWAGIHFRSDDVAGLRLGEDVSISILQELALLYTEQFDGFSFIRLTGERVRISSKGEVNETPPKGSIIER